MRKSSAATCRREGHWPRAVFGWRSVLPRVCMIVDLQSGMIGRVAEAAALPLAAGGEFSRESLGAA